MGVIRLFDGPETLSNLSSETIDLIHATKTAPAIKRLLQAYDILELNLYIQKQFCDFSACPPWDFAALQDLNTVRRELLVYHHMDFNPAQRLQHYSEKLRKLLFNVALNFERSDLGKL